MKDTTLVIMAAGIGSRFGKGIKQLEPMGPNGEIIMDYSIHDAIEAGFNKVVFIIRKDLEKDFRETIGKRVESWWMSVTYSRNWMLCRKDSRSRKAERNLGEPVRRCFPARERSTNRL